MEALVPQVGNAAVRKLAQTLVCRKYYIVAIFVISVRDLSVGMIHTKVSMRFNLFSGYFLLHN